MKIYYENLKKIMEKLEKIKIKYIIFYIIKNKLRIIL